MDSTRIKNNELLKILDCHYGSRPINLDEPGAKYSCKRIEIIGQGAVCAGELPGSVHRPTPTANWCTISSPITSSFCPAMGNLPSAS